MLNKCTRYFSYCISFSFPSFLQTSIFFKTWIILRGEGVLFSLFPTKFSNRYAVLNRFIKSSFIPLAMSWLQAILFWSNFVWQKRSFPLTVVLNDTLYNETLPHKYLHYIAKAFYGIGCLQLISLLSKKRSFLLLSHSGFILICGHYSNALKLKKKTHLDFFFKVRLILNKMNALWLFFLSE